MATAESVISAATIDPALLAALKAATPEQVGDVLVLRLPDGRVFYIDGFFAAEETGDGHPPVPDAIALARDIADLLLGAEDIATAAGRMPRHCHPVAERIGALIVLGGVVFPVLAELGARGRPVTRHARWVVAATIGLIAAGAVLLAVFEGYGALAALFQSITLRTAGFNTVPLGALGLPAVALCVAFMLVGGSPAGTAGGFKTTTGIAAFSALAGRPGLDRPTARRAARLLAVFLAAFVSFVVVVALAQGGLHRRLVFEVASALGTVGLTMDCTDELGAGARLLICLAMFVGRVGPKFTTSPLLLMPKWSERK